MISSQISSVVIVPKDSEFTYSGNKWAICGFTIALKRKTTPILFQVYLTSTILVIVSWVSFIVDPNVVPGRMGLLVTILLVLINIFISVKHQAPTSSGSLNAVDVFLVVCILEFFAAVLEYALVLCGFGKLKEQISPSVVLKQGSLNIKKKKTSLSEANIEVSKKKSICFNCVEHAVLIASKV